MHNQKRPRLGKGLGALINSRVEVPASSSSATESMSRTESDRSEAADGNPSLQMIPIRSIVPNRFQPRQEIDPESLKQLADSIRTAGVMQPIVIRKTAGNERGVAWELVAGERRWRAAALAGLETLPALVADVDDRAAAEWAIIENVQREDLNPMDRAWAFKNLAVKFGLSQLEIAERVGVDRSSVSNLIRLTELEREIQDAIAHNQLSTGHGKALLGSPPGIERVALGDRCRREHWSVRRLERWVALAGEGVSGAVEPEPAAAVSGSASLSELEKQLGDHLGTRVRIRTDASRSRGKLVIDFYNLDQFDGITARMGFQMRS